MSYGEIPYEDHLYGIDEQMDRWESRYAEELDRQMEAQYTAELQEQYERNIFPPLGTYPCGICPLTFDSCRCQKDQGIMSLAHQVLHCPMVQPNDADAQTVGEFLGLLLSTLWLENEGFSGKRPLGNSDWQWQVYMSLVKAGLAIGTVYNDDGYDELEDWTHEAEIAADELILQSIKLMYDHES